MREQGACLVNAMEPGFMLVFDELPPEARDVLRESSYDLCTACFQQKYNQHFYQGVPPALAASRAVWEMEQEIREREQDAA